MIRAALVLIALAMVAAGVGWLGEAGWPPLIVVHEGEQVRVEGPGKRDLILREPGRLGWRIPFFSRATIVDTRVRRDLVETLAIGNLGDRVAVEVWWRVTDAPSFLDSSSVANTEPSIGANLDVPFEQVLHSWSLERTLGGEGGVLEAQLLSAARDALAERGVEVLDIRLARREGGRLLESMRGKREAHRDRLRREVAEVGPRLRLEAKSEAARIESTALRDAEVMRGRAEAEVARIYADAHQTAPEFYTFSRQLEAYRNTLGANTTLVLSPDHEFFRLLSPSGATGR